MIYLCNCTGETCDCPIPELAELWQRNKNNANPDITDIIALTDLITVDFYNLRPVPYAPYWDFFDEVIENIRTGKWSMHPFMWKPYIMNASYLPMARKDIEQRMSTLRMKCANVLRDRGLPVSSLNNRQLLVIWARNPNGFQDMLATVKTIVELNTLFSKKGK